MTPAFWERAALELSMLEFGIPILPLSSDMGALDLRENAHLTVHMSEGVCDGVREDFRDRMLALFFGAAWKVLDLLIEDVLRHQGGEVPWEATKKASLLSSGRSPFALLPDDIGAAVTALYVNTIELRHALVHRQAQVLENGDLCGTTRTGEPLALAITRGHQLAFCDLAQRVAHAYRHSALSRRDEAAIRAQLHLLTDLHMVAEAGREAGRLMRVKVALRDDGVLAVGDIWRVARRCAPGVTMIDLELYLPDGSILAGPLEERGGSDTIVIDATAPPDWVSPLPLREG